MLQHIVLKKVCPVGEESGALIYNHCSVTSVFERNDLPSIPMFHLT